MSNSRLDLLFKRYLEGSCTREEEQELIELISDRNNPDARGLLKDIWNDPVDKLQEEKSGAILDSILKRKDKRVILRKQIHTWAIAASITALLCFTALAFYEYSNSDPSQTTIVRFDKNPQEKKYITLPDGSKVILNDSSELDYKASFTENGIREVYLIGEAFFDIRHHENRPFIVHTGKISTTVLGTAFNVKAYPKENDITITVSRGKVKVSDEKQVLGILTPDQQITFDKNSEEIAHHTVKTNEAVQWIENDIFFDDISMVEAARRLEDRFHKKITFKNEKIKNCKFTASFLKGESLDQILEVICEFNQARYKADGSGNIEISGPGCQD